MNKVKELIDDGHITKNQAKKINKQLKSEFEKLQSKENVDEVDMIESTLNILRNNIRDEDLKTDTSKCAQECKQEHKLIILSEYFIN